jgi:hypothetical protein
MDVAISGGQRKNRVLLTGQQNANKKKKNRNGEQEFHLIYKIRVNGI